MKRDDALACRTESKGLATLARLLGRHAAQEYMAQRIKVAGDTEREEKSCK